MSETSTPIGYAGRTIGREELALLPTPPATETTGLCRITKLSKLSSRLSDSATSRTKIFGRLLRQWRHKSSIQSETYSCFDAIYR